MRDIPLADLGKILKAQAGDWVAFNLIEIAHPDETTLRYACANGDITHDGNVYQGRGFEILLPSQSRTELGDGSLSIDDTDQELTLWVTRINRAKRTTLSLFVVSTEDLDHKLVGPFSYRILEALPQNEAMHFTLTFEDGLREEYPFCKFDRHYPGLQVVVR